MIAHAAIGVRKSVVVLIALFAVLAVRSAAASEGALWAHGETPATSDGSARPIQYGPWQVADHVVAAAGARYGEFYLTSSGELRRLWYDHTEPDSAIIDRSVAQFSVAVDHLVWRKTDGTVWGIGYTMAGLPDPDGDGMAREPVVMASGVSYVAGSFYNTYFIKPDGTLWGMGFNSFHQLDDGDVYARHTTPVALASGVKAVAGCSQFVLWIDAANVLWIRGNEPGGDYFALPDPAAPRGVRQVMTDVKEIRCGRDHALILKNSGELFVVGLGREGDLGVVDALWYLDMTIYRPVMSLAVPRRLAEHVVTMDAGETTTVFVREDGVAWACGTGVDPTLQSHATPIPIASGVIAVGAGYHALMTVHAPTAGISDQPRATLRHGNEVVPLAVTCSALPATYQWYVDGVAIPDATSAVYSAPRPGTYRVVVGGTTLSEPARVTQTARLSNFSARARVTAAHPIETGYSVEGLWTAARYSPSAQLRKPMVLRGAGPALQAFGVAERLLTPRITLYGYHEFDGFDAPTTPPTNADWDEWYRELFKRWFNAAGAFPFADNSGDAALLVQVSPGVYQPHVTSNTTAEGVALAEIYEMDATDSLMVVNASARAWAGRGADVLTGGFTITGTEPMTVLVRAVGPTLRSYGVADALLHPKLMVFDARGAVVASNVAWRTAVDPAALVSAAVATHASALANDSDDSALLLTLAPGCYTAQVAGNDGASGEALLEVYRVE